MRGTRTIAAGLLLTGLVLVLPGSAGAGERPAGLEPGARAHVLAAGLETLRLRMEARMKAGDVLRQLGRVEEALQAYREVEALHDSGIHRLESLLARFGGRAVAGVRARAPVAVGIPKGARGRVFRGRGGKVSGRVEVEGRPEAGGTFPTAGVEGTQIGLGPILRGGAFRYRGAGAAEGAAKYGASRRSQTAVEDALKWLTAHQSPNGGWQASGFEKWCDGKPVAEGPDGLGKSFYDPGVTGLALLAYLGAGYTNRGRHPFAKTVSRGLRYLKNIQDAEGCFGPRTSQHFIYNHAFAALAMVEAYGMTQSPIFKGSAQKALDFTLLTRNPYFGWRYGVKPGDNDTSVTAAMTMVLKSAKLVNEAAVKEGLEPQLPFEEAASEGIRAWIDKMTDPDYGRVGYIQRGGSPARPQELIDRFPAEKSEAMTAAGILCRIFLGEDPRQSEVIGKGADLLGKLPPTWNPTDGSIDMYYWFYGTLAQFQVGGQNWKGWNDALKTAVLDSQRKDTTYCGYKGSWDPIGPWGPDGGRVYSTALMALCMEVYYRYDKVHGTK